MTSYLPFPPHPHPSLGSGSIPGRYGYVTQRQYKTEAAAEEWAAEHGGVDRIVEDVAKANPALRKFLKDD